jgi:hypothetical protein
MSQGMTTIRVDPDLRDRLADLKWVESMSFNDLLEDMADRYDPPMEAR